MQKQSCMRRRSIMVWRARDTMDRMDKIDRIDRMDGMDKRMLPFLLQHILLLSVLRPLCPLGPLSPLGSLRPLTSADGKHTSAVHDEQCSAFGDRGARNGSAGNFLPPQQLAVFGVERVQEFIVVAEIDDSAGDGR